MPSVSIYYQNTNDKKRLKACLGRLRGFVATQLSDPQRQLKPEEMSMRLLKFSSDSLPIAPIELEIVAYSYAGRVKRQDEICRAINGFLKDNSIKNSYTWLQLCELGHSAEN